MKFDFFFRVLTLTNNISESSLFHYKNTRFKKSPQLPGAERTRAWHHHGSEAPTSSRIILLHSSLLGCVFRDYVRGGAEGALAPPEFGVQKGEQKEKQTIHY